MIEPSFDCCNKSKNKRCCVDVVIFILTIAFAFILGVVIGAVTGLFDALGIGALIAILIILFLLIAIRIVLLACSKNKC